MQLILVISHADGTTQRVPVGPEGVKYPVSPGDDVQLMDLNGFPVKANLQPDGANLNLISESGIEVSLENFYNQEPDAEPIHVSLKPETFEQTNYEFNAQVGNLPGSDNFSLMRYSNTGYTEFDDQLRNLSGDEIGGSAGTGGGGGGSPQSSPPTAVNDTATTGEHDVVNMAILANDFDSDGDPFSLGVINGQSPQVDEPIVLPSGATVTLLSNGTVDYDPGEAFQSLNDGEEFVDRFTYTIIDGNGDIDIATGSITIIGEDDAAETNPDTAVVAEGATVAIDVLANDLDPDTTDNPLVVGGITQPGPGLGVVTTDGSQVFFDSGTDFEDLGVGETEIVTFTYVAESTDGTTVTETATVTVTGENDDPEAFDDAEEVTENAIVNIDLLSATDSPGGVADSDIDGDTLSIIQIDNSLPGGPITLASGAEVVVRADGTVDYDTNGLFDGLDNGETFIDSFVYTVSDGHGGTATATTTITINGEDDPIIGGADEGSVDEGETVVINVLANDTDPDNADDPVGPNVDDPLTVTAVETNPTAGGTVTTDGTNVSFDPGTDFEGLGEGETQVVTFTYTASTDDGETVTETVTITVNGTNDTPIAVDDTAVVAENGTVDIDLLSATDSPSGNSDSDVDGDTLTVTGIDGVSAAGVMPIASGAQVTINSDGTIGYDANGAFESLDDGETFIDSFVYEISDGHGGTATATATITVTGEDDPTIINPDSATSDEDTPVTIDVLGNDSDPDTNDNPLTVASVTQPPSGTVTNNGSDVTFDPGTDFQGLGEGETATVTFTYTTDTGATETVTITVNGTNDGPTAVNDAETTDEDVPVNLNLLSNDTDPDTNDDLSIVGIEVGGAIVVPTEGLPLTLDNGGTVTLLGDGTLDYAPPAGQDSLDDGESFVDSFVYQISDGNGGTATATSTVTINGVDDPTIANPDSETIDENATVTVDVLGNDTDPDTSDNPLTVASVTQPPSGTVTNNGSDVTFDPGTDFEGLGEGESATVTFTYTTDTGVSQTATITVTGSNDGPTALNDAETTNEDVPVNINVLSNDTDPDTNDDLSVVGIEVGGAIVVPTEGLPLTLDNGGTVTLLGDGTLDYAPPAGQDSLDDGESFVDSFVYQISDGNGGTATATTTVTINGVDDPTIANPDTETLDENATVTVDVLGNDSDPDASDNPLTVASVTQPPSVP